jgi:hypothetical protein
VSGILRDFTSQATISNATMEARRDSNDSLLDLTTSQGDGSFSLSLVTGGVPLAAHLTVGLAGYPPTGYFFADPLANDLAGLAVRAVSSTNLVTLYGVAGLSHTSGAGTPIVLVADCSGAPIEHATVGLSPVAARLDYLRGSLPSATASSTDATGLAIGFDVPSGTNTVSAAFLGHTLEAHIYRVLVDGVSFTVIHP